MEDFSRSLILKRGTEEQIKNKIFKLGEIVFDVTNLRIVVGDGKTPGGIAMARADEIKKVKNGK